MRAEKMIFLTVWQGQLKEKTLFWSHPEISRYPFSKRGYKKLYIQPITIKWINCNLAKVHQN